LIQKGAAGAVSDLTQIKELRFTCKLTCKGAASNIGPGGRFVSYLIQNISWEIFPGKYIFFIIYIFSHLYYITSRPRLSSDLTETFLNKNSEKILTFYPI